MPPRGSRSTPARTHYPSWGLETTGSCRIRPNRSIPHYPSWGLETRRRIHRLHLRQRSLPLMGIGNVGEGSFGRHAFALTHYPSWGLETATILSPAAEVCGTHYPSWGLETPAGAAGPDEASELITPHGDWKLDDGDAGTAVTVRSLPLMGIGNWSRTADEPVVEGAHYPSWGLETREPPEHLAPQVRLLITPHGDWKPPWGFGPDSRRPAGSHYPSWGLETARQAASTCVDCDSLPLMGIGNHPPLRPAPPTPDLITPHGDWKPCTSAWRAATSPRSLPLMGIGNR